MLRVPGYRIEEEAGRGGWSVVYRAVDVETGARVALKTIAPELAGEPWYRERFRRECEIAGALEHPNLIPVYATGESWAAMRWVEGATLRDLAPVEPARAAAILAQVAAALDLMHARGFVHRDVKPGNVLVGPGDHAYLTDLGLAKEISADPGLTPEGRWLGTVDFAAPEQIRARPTDARSDVYSLGCVLGYAVTGSAPYPRPSAEAKMHAHLYEPPPRLPPELAALDPVLGRALAKDPAWRFRSAGELARAAAAATGARAHPAGALHGADGSRRTAVAAVASLAVAAAAVVVALALIAGGEESAPQEDAPPDPRPLVGQQLELSSDTNWDRWGSAVVARRGSLTVEANLKPAGRGREYEVWLSNNRLDARSLGTFDVRPGDDALVKVDLPERGLSGYEWLEITLEPEPTDEKHSGKTLLKGRVAELTGG